MRTLEQLLKKAEQQNQDFAKLAETYREIARIYHKKKDRKKSVKYNKLSKEAKGKVPVKEKQINVSFNVEAKEIDKMPQSLEKIEKLKDLLKRHPKQTSIYGIIALSYERIKYYDDAKKYYELFLAKHDKKDKENYAGGCNNYANILTDHFQEYKEAMELYEKAIKLSPNDHDTHYNFAMLLATHFQEYNKAKEYYEKASEINPNNANSFYNYAKLLKNHFNEYEKAKEYYERAIDINPNFSLAYNNYALLLTGHFQEHEKAKGYYEKAIEISPNLAEAHINYAILLANHFDDTKKALYHFDKAIELSKNKDLSDGARKGLMALTGNEPVLINGINAKKVLHLRDVEIKIDSKEVTHLLITGENGCGKTVLMDRLCDYLQKITETEPEKALIKGFEKNIDSENPDLISFVPDANKFYYKYRTGEFIIAHFDARRELKLHGIESVDNVSLETYQPIKENGKTFYKKDIFLKFAVNQYVQAALAAMENDNDKVNMLNRWKENFEQLIKTIDPRIEKVSLETKPNYYFKLTPKPPLEPFTFEQLADGFESIFSIVAELMLRMQNKTITSYNIEGLVLIDEPEAHLHLKMQKQILPILTKIFPRVQFIVNTHSPFILSSL